MFPDSHCPHKCGATGANALRLISLPAVKGPENKISRTAFDAVKTDLRQVAVLGIRFKTNQKTRPAGSTSERATSPLAFVNRLYRIEGKQSLIILSDPSR